MNKPKKKSRKPRRVVLGVGYLHDFGLSRIKKMNNANWSYYGVGLRRLSIVAGNKIRLIAEVLK